MSRRNRGVFWAPRGSSINNSSDSDDFPLAFLLARTAQSRKKKTPAKRATPKQTRQATRARRAQPPVAMINLVASAVAEANQGSPCSDTVADSPVEVDSYLENFQPSVDLVVKSKVGSKVSDFFKSGRFLSSDEEDMEETSKPPAPAATVVAEVCLTDDSDVEICPSSAVAEPSTSATSQVQQTKEDILEIKQIKPNDSDAFMDYVDSVLSGIDSTSKCTNDGAANDMKSLEDFSKETEEMLKDANSLLNELKGTKKQQEEVKKPEEVKPPAAPEPEAPPVSACSICYEPYSNVPAAATICGHIFCKPCITMACKTSKKCPTCRKALTLKKIHPIYFN